MNKRVFPARDMLEVFPNNAGGITIYSKWDTDEAHVFVDFDRIPQLIIWMQEILDEYAAGKYDDADEPDEE